MPKNIKEYSVDELNRTGEKGIEIFDYTRKDYSYGCTIISYRRRATAFSYVFCAITIVLLPVLAIADDIGKRNRETHYFYTETGEELGSSKEEAINRTVSIGEEKMKQKKYAEASSYFNIAYNLCDDSREGNFKTKRDEANEEIRKEQENKERREREAKERETRAREEARERERRQREIREREAKEREAKEREAKEQKAKEREAKEIYQKAHKMWNEAFILENNDSVAEAKKKFEESNKLFLKASTIIPNEVLYSNWFHISSLKLAGDSLFNEALNLQEQGNLLRQKEKYKEAIEHYKEAQNKYTEGFNKSKDTRFKACIEFVESCIKEVNDLIQVGDIEEQIHNIQVETGRNNVNTEEDTNEETILHQLIDA